jgi:DnaJ-class molecular chaperone
MNKPGEGTYGYPNHQSGVQSGNLSDQPGMPPGGRVKSPGDEASEGTMGTGRKTCPSCGGSGRINDHTCQTCQGEGTIVAGIGGG